MDSIGDLKHPSIKQEALETTTSNPDSNVVDRRNDNGAKVENTKPSVTICRLCYMSFPSSAEMKDHTKSVHSGELELLTKQFTVRDLVHPCNVCPLRFVTKNILDTHTKMQHRKNVEMAAVKCKICNKSFPKKHLWIHTKSHRTSKDTTKVPDKGDMMLPENSQTMNKSDKNNKTTNEREFELENKNVKKSRIEDMENSYNATLDEILLKEEQEPVVGELVQEKTGSQDQVPLEWNPRVNLEKDLEKEISEEDKICRDRNFIYFKNILCGIKSDST